MPDDTPKKSKPTHDARQEYYDTLKFVMVNTAKAFLIRDATTATTGLRLQYNMVSPYVDQTPDFTTIPHELLQAENKFVGTHHAFRNTAFENARRQKVNEGWNTLLNIDLRIREAAKHVQLPTGTDGIVDFDLDEFKRGSGL